jgi:hypothetical protein
MRKSYSADLLIEPCQDGVAALCRCPMSNSIPFIRPVHRRGHANYFRRSGCVRVAAIRCKRGVFCNGEGTKLFSRIMKKARPTRASFISKLDV